MDALKSFAGLEEGSGSGGFASSWNSQFDQQCSMTRTQRMYGFAVCFVLGWLLNIMSLLSIGSIVTNPSKFAVLFTLGNVISLASTAFLWGPISQLKNMFKPIRIGATLTYLFAMGLTLGFAFGLHSAPAVIISMLLQFCAMVWYAASYIPYGREILLRVLGGCCKGAIGMGDS